VAGQSLTEDDFYMAIPLQKGQVSSRELMLGKYGHKLLSNCTKDQPITVDILDTPYSSDPALLETFKVRGL
jgi:N-acetylneuraminate synthase